jgi:Tfp pilus assembly ATPase PilU
MSKRGLVLVVGATGCAKSTSLAAMIDHRNPVPGNLAFQQCEPDDRPHHQFLFRGAKQLLMDLSGSLRAIISQRLVRTADGKGRKAAIEILLKTPTIADKLLKGEFHEIKTIMQKSRELGMRPFDASLFELYDEGAISYEEAIRNADSANELPLNIELNGTRQGPDLALQATA